MSSPEPPVAARQPIFDRRRRVLAYELLYRGPAQADGSAATARVLIDALVNFDFGLLGRDVRLFVNMPRAALDWSLEQTLPPGRLVLEVLEDIEPDAALEAALARQRAAGFAVALDDFDWSDAHERLLAHANYVKLDVLALGERLGEVVARCRRPGLTLIAEKVETQTELERCAALGFDAFQGYVYCRPERVGHGPLPGPSIVLVNLVARLRDPLVTALELAALIRRDATLAYQVLRLANSPLRGVRRQIRSIEDAVVVLGADPIRHWASLLTLARLASGKPRELLEFAAARGAMCVRAGSLLGVDEREMLYTIGMFSMLDALLDRDMASILGGIALADPVREALLGEGTGILRSILSSVTDFERGPNQGAGGALSPRLVAVLAAAQSEALADSRATLGAAG